MTAIALKSHRQQFPALTNKAYFNYGGQGPLPTVALEAIYQSHQYVQQAGPFSGAVNDWLNNEGDKTRSAIASSLGVTPQTISIAEDVTVGCNIALWGIDWQPGDHLVISDCEHPGIVATVQELQRRFGIEVSKCTLKDTLNQGDPVAAVAKEVRSPTRLVVLSHILWNTGQVLPLAEIANACKQQGNQHDPPKILVDAAQSVGVLPLKLDELNVDFYAFTGHKWWCGPEGVGGLYVHPNALEKLHPTFIGWRSIITSPAGEPIGFQPDGRRFEIATSATPLYAGLREAIALHERWGSIQERYQQIQKLSHYLWSRLMQLNQIKCLRTSPPEAGLVSFQVSGDRHQQLVQFLEDQSIFVRLIRDPNCVRASVHYFTTTDEIDQLVEAIANFKFQIS